MFRKFTYLMIGSVLIATSSYAMDIDWFTVDGGGASLTAGGDFELSGTIGQPDAGAPLTGGDFQLVGGFWAGAAAAGMEPCVGDLDGDMDVDFDDLNLLLSAYGTSIGDPGYHTEADLDGDDDVDFDDLNVLLSGYGDVCS